MQPQPIQNQIKHIIADLHELSPTRIAEVEDFIAFLKQREAEREIVFLSTLTSEKILHKIWDNKDDAAYDQL